MGNYSIETHTWSPVSQITFVILFGLVFQMLLGWVFPPFADAGLSALMLRQMTGMIGLFLLPPLVLLFLRKNSAEKTWGLIPSFNIRHWMLALLVLPLLFPAGDALATWWGSRTDVPQWWQDLRQLQEQSEAFIELVLGSTGGTRIVAFTMIVIIPPLAEELFFRGTLQRLLRKVAHPYLALGVTALIFALFHGQIDNLPGLILLGLALGWIYESTGKLWVCIAAHMVYNAGVWYWHVSGLAADVILSPVIITASTALAAVVLYLSSGRQKRKKPLHP